MLQMNFLPIRQLKKRKKAQGQLAALLLLFILAVALCALAWLIQSHNIDSVRKENARLTSEKQSLQPSLAVIDQLNQAREELERKTKVIERLKKESSLTVHIMDEIASRVDSSRLGLDSMAQTGGSIELKGVALDNESIAQFLDSLKASSFLHDVSLVESSQKLLAGRDLKSFTISCKAASLGSEDASKPKSTP